MKAGKRIRLAACSAPWLGFWASAPMRLLRRATPPDVESVELLVVTPKKQRRRSPVA